MDERDSIAESVQRVAGAIARRDLAALRGLLAPGFVHRTPGGESVDTDEFLRRIELIPGDITFVRLEHVEIDICNEGALVTGIQHAQVLVDGTSIDDRGRFVDWLVKDAGGWRIRVAVSVPEEGPT